MLANLRADISRLEEIKRRKLPWCLIESLLFENGFQAVVLHRIAHWFRRHHVPVLPPFFARLSLWLTGVDISPAAEIGPGLLISHGVGLVVGGGVRLGKGALLHHQVTLGAPTRSRIGQMPRIGDEVVIGAGARVIGDVEIGDGVFIGVNAIVTRDLPDRCKAVSDTGLRVETQDDPAAPLRATSGGDPSSSLDEV